MLTVNDIMQTEVMTAYEDTPLFEITQQLMEKEISCVMIVDRSGEDNVVMEKKSSFFSKFFGNKKTSSIKMRSSRIPLGIISDLDLIDAVGQGMDSYSTIAKSIMSTELITVESGSTILNCINQMKDNKLHRLPVVEKGMLVGLVTQTDILFASLKVLQEIELEINNISIDMDEYRILLSKSSELDGMPDVAISINDTVEKIMIREVITIDAETSVQQTAKRMSEENVGCIIATREGSPCGIVCNGDILKKVVLEKIEPQQTPISQIMSAPIFSIPSTLTIQQAVDLNHTNGFKRFPVVEDNTLLGILTLSDIRKAMGAAVKKAESDLIKRWSELLEPAFKKKEI